MSKIERLASGFGLEPPFTSTVEALPVSNPWTLAIRAHAIEDARGRRVTVYEKQVANRPKWSGGSPETLFHARVLPHWPTMRSHVCALFGMDRGLFSTRLYLAAAPDAERPARERYTAALALLPGMHRTGSELLASGALDDRLQRRLDFYWPALERGLHRERLKRALANPRCAALLEPRSKALTDALDRLADAAREAPRAICHLDLLANNIFVGDGRTVLIDWGEVAIAPFGFDYGSLMAGAVRNLRPNQAAAMLEAIWARLRDVAAVGPDSEATLEAARYYLLFGLVRYLSATQLRTPPVKRMVLIGELVDELCGPSAAGRFA